MHIFHEDANLLADVFDSLQEAIVILNRDSAIIAMNQSAQISFGLSRAPNLDRPFMAFLRINPQLEMLLKKTQKTGFSIAHYEIKIRNLEGREVPSSISISPLYTKDGEIKGTILLSRDITMLKSLEEETEISTRLSSIEIIAAGLAHEIKNPLSALRGAAQILSKSIHSNEKFERCCDIIIKEADRIDRIVRELLNLTRPKMLSLKKINLHEILERIINMTATSITKKDIKFVREYDPSLPQLLCDEEKIVQLFTNLIKNAIDAIDRKGIVKLRTSIITDYHFLTAEKKKCKMVSVEVSDTGRGIREEDFPKIFTPFFTTKPDGSGLGLTVCHKIVSDHNGSIRFKSAPGKGTTFIIILPIFDGNET